MGLLLSHLFLCVKIFTQTTNKLHIIFTFIYFNLTFFIIKYNYKERTNGTKINSKKKLKNNSHHLTINISYSIMYLQREKKNHLERRIKYTRTVTNVLYCLVLLFYYQKKNNTQIKSGLQR